MKNKTRGSVLIHVLVTALIVAVIASALMQMVLMRVQMASRMASSATNQQLAMSVYNQMSSYWNNNGFCTSFLNYTCVGPATCSTAPAVCVCNTSPASTSIKAYLDSGLCVSEIITP